MNFDRTLTLLGKDNFNKIINKKFLIIGIGGVGGYTLESLVRMGIKDITIIDFDKIDPTNLNRQIITNLNNIGNYKVDEALIRYNLINKELNLKCIKEKLTIDNFDTIINSKYDYIIDACDDVIIKKELIKYAINNNIKIITSCGTAKKIDASKLYITRLDKTENDPLAKKLRSLLRKENISLKIPVVSSKESTKKIDTLGSVSYVPAVAGLLITSYIINDIIN